MKQFLKKYRYLLLFVTTVGGLFSFMSMQEQSDYWYFYDGQEMHWKVQPDVFVFRTKTHTQYTGPMDSNIVASTVFRNDNPDKINIIFFKAGASASAISEVEQEVTNDSSFESAFPAITMVPGAVYNENLWYFANDLVMVTFNSDSLGTANASRIATQYGLQPYGTPAGIAGGSYTYIYSFTPNSTHPDGLELSRTIFINEAKVISDAEPNLVKVYSQQATTTGITAPENGKEEFYVVNDNEHTLRVYYQLHSNSQAASVKLYDMFGRQFASKQVSSYSNQIQLDISALSSGIYFSSMEDSNGKSLFTRKFRKL